MHPTAEPAIGRGDDALTSDQISKPHDPICDELWVFDDIRRVTNDTGQDQLVIR